MLHNVYLSVFYLACIIIMTICIIYIAYEVLIMVRKTLRTERPAIEEIQLNPQLIELAFLGLPLEEFLRQDNQNVHDHGVVSCQQDIIDRLIKEQEGEILPSLRSIKNDFSVSYSDHNNSDQNNSDQNKIAKVMQVIEQIEKNENVQTLKITDKECIRRIWKRIYDPRNEKNRELMKLSLFDNLYDCWEDNAIVCVQGRVSRILNCLTMLDFDPQNWEVKRIEQLRQDIYSNASQIIQDVSENCLRSTDPEIQKVGQSFLAKSPEDLPKELKPEACKVVYSEMETKIHNMVQAFNISDELKDELLTNACLAIYE